MKKSTKKVSTKHRTQKKHFADLSISKKLQVSFANPIISFVIALIFSIAAIAFIGSSFTKFYNSSFHVVKAQMEMQKNLQKSSNRILLACATSDEKLTKQRIDEASEELANLKDNFEVLKKLYKEDTKIIERFSNDLASISQYQETMCKSASVNDNYAALNLYYTGYSRVLTDAENALEEIADQVEILATDSYTASNIIEIIVIIFCCGLAIFSILIALSNGKRLLKAFIRPLEEIETAAKQMSEGSLHVNISYESEDELGRLANNMRITTSGISKLVDDMSNGLQTMADGNFNVKSSCADSYIGDYASIFNSMENIASQLSHTISEIKEAASQVSQGAENLAEGAQSLAEGATDQANSVEGLTATVKEITAQVNDTASSSKLADKMALEVTNEATHSREQMQNMTNAMSRITETSSQIEVIIQSIENIASQTNLLSLNAAIEAARAGEAGRGFAVVADEIRELASQSESAAMNTRQLIQSTVNEIHSGNEIVEITSSSLNQVVDSIQNMRDIIQKTTALSVEQSQSMEEIDKGITEISAVVQNTSATAQESSATSEELTAQAEALNSLVDQFVTR